MKFDDKGLVFKYDYQLAQMIQRRDISLAMDAIPFHLRTLITIDII